MVKKRNRNKKDKGLFSNRNLLIIGVILLSISLFSYMGGDGGESSGGITDEGTGPKVEAKRVNCDVVLYNYYTVHAKIDSFNCYSFADTCAPVSHGGQIPPSLNDPEQNDINTVLVINLGGSIQSIPFEVPNSFGIPTKYVRGQSILKSGVCVPNEVSIAQATLIDYSGHVDTDSSSF